MIATDFSIDLQSRLACQDDARLCTPRGGLSRAREGVKKSRLCRLLCGRARPFRTAGLRLNSLGAAASAGGQRFIHTFRVSEPAELSVIAVPIHSHV